MEPKASLTAFVVVILLAVTLLSLQGDTTTATVTVVGLSAYAALLDLSYLLRSRSRRLLILAHRRYLDRIVRSQWVALLLLGGAIAQGLEVGDIHPLDGDSDAVEAVVVAVSIGIVVIYASALVDWYWVLPKVSGIVAPPPCTTAVAKTYAGVTKVWYFHRAVATAVVTALIAGTPAYIAGTGTGGGASARALLTLLGAAAAIGFNAATAGTVWAFTQYLSPRLEVGSYVRKRKDIDDPEPQDGYVSDVSVQGITVKLECDVDGTFVKDGDLLPYHEAQQVTKSNRRTPMCPSLQECQAANWYCLRNRNANTSYAPALTAPAELPSGASEM